MERIQNISDIAKETITYLSFFNEEMINKIPSNFISKLCEEAAESNLDFYIDTSKPLEEQEMSEECKDLIALIYYSYIADQNEKNEILKQWNQNEKNTQNLQDNQYNLNDLFKSKTKSVENNTEETMMIEYKKDNIFSKIRRLLKKLLNLQ